MTSRSGTSKSAMKISGGISEDDVIVGNTYDKYGSRNPLVRWIMHGFESRLEELVALAKPASIHELGCGEGYWVMRWSAQGHHVRGSDFSATIIEMARSNARERGLPETLFEQKSIYDFNPVTDSAELIVCCEVLEHLEYPDLALQALQKTTGRHVIFSVPREPLWGVLNMARGKYLSQCGNSPGHVQRWSRRAFVRLVSRYFRIQEVRSPLPWTLLLCSPIQGAGQALV